MYSKCKDYIKNDLALSVDNFSRAFVLILGAEGMTDFTGMIALTCAFLFVVYAVIIKEENKYLKECMNKLEAQQNKREEKIVLLKQALLNNSEIINQQQEKIAEYQTAKITQQSTAQISRMNHNAGNDGIANQSDSFFKNPDFKRSECRRRTQTNHAQDESGVLESDRCGLIGGNQG